MLKKIKIDFMTSTIMLFYSGIIMLLPLFNITNVKIAFAIIMTVYQISNLINYILVKESKDTEGLYTFFISLISSILVFILNVNTNPMYLALILLIWTFGMSLIKLKKADYYHDKKNPLWILHILLLFIFILISLLTTINLYYNSEIQILMIGNFFFVNGVLDIIDPIVNYIKEKN